MHSLNWIIWFSYICTGVGNGIRNICIYIWRIKLDFVHCSICTSFAMNSICLFCFLPSWPDSEAPGARGPFSLACPLKSECIFVSQSHGEGSVSSQLLCQRISDWPRGACLNTSKMLQMATDDLVFCNFYFIQQAERKVDGRSESRKGSVSAETTCKQLIAHSNVNLEISLCCCCFGGALMLYLFTKLLWSGWIFIQLFGVFKFCK